MKNKSFPFHTPLFGAAYYLEYMPYDRMEEDMRLMKKANMNVIRIGESTWSTWEPTEGHFDFTLLDRMLDLAEENEIFVIIGTPTYAIPTWLCKKYPDILAITHGGPGLYGHRQNMDITHKGYLQHCEIIIRAMLSHIGDRKHIIGFQLDNETKSYDTAGPNVQAQFVEYLKELFPDIQAMNDHFGLAYWSNRIDDWDAFPDVRGTINASLSGEFKKFQRKLVTDFLTWQAEIVKEYAREDQFITHNFDYGWKDHSFGMQPEVNQYESACAMTIAGCDIYHPSQSDLTGTEISFGGSIARSIKRDNYLVLETQSQGNVTWLPYEGQLRLQAFSHFANGANSVMYWNWHSIHNAIESYWKGVLSHDLKENDTYLEAMTIGKDLQAIGDHLIDLKKKCEIAILLDNQSLTGISAFSLESGTPGDPATAFGYNDIFRWIHDALYKMNLECDILQSSDVLEQLENGESLLDSYKLIITPALYSAPSKLLKALSSYVEGGGHLLSSFKTGYADEYLKIYPDTHPYELHHCFGMHYQQYTVPKNVTLDLGCEASHWMELLIPDTASTWATYEHFAYQKYAAITHNSFGKGTATYLGCHFSEASLQLILTRLVNEISLSHSSFSFPIICKTGTNRYQKEIRYYFNFSSEKITISLCKESLPWKSATSLLTNTIIGAQDSFSLTPYGFVILEELD